jgi:hypothetical protein
MARATRLESYLGWMSHRIRLYFFVYFKIISLYCLATSITSTGVISSTTSCMYINTKSEIELHIDNWSHTELFADVCISYIEIDVNFVLYNKAWERFANNLKMKQFLWIFTWKITVSLKLHMLTCFSNIINDYNVVNQHKYVVHYICTEYSSLYFFLK